MVKRSYRPTYVRKSRLPAVIKKKNYKKKPAVKLAPVMKKLINMQLQRRQETHDNSRTIFSDVNYNGAINGTDLHCLAPSFARGTDPSQYIGDQLRLKSMVAHLHLRCSPDITSANDDQTLYIRVVVFSCKEFRNNNDIVAADRTYMADNLLKIAGVELGYDGTTYRKVIPYNTQKYTIHYSRDIPVVMDKNHHVGTGTSLNVVTSRPWMRYLKIPLKVNNKVLTFDNTNEYPNNYAPHIAIGFVNARIGAQPDLSTRVNATCHVFYRWTE